MELVDNMGWIVESAAESGAVLDQATDGRFVVEHITGEFGGVFVRLRASPPPPD